MTTQAYLGQLRNIDFEIKSICTEEKSLRDIATNMHKNIDDILVDKSPNPGRMEDMVIRIIDREKKACDRRDRLIETKLHIEDQIKGMENRFYYMLLWLSYHDDKRLYEIAHMINYSPKHAKRKIREAENAFEKKYGAEYAEK